ncbi:diguanylate cyclase domain-containing protein [Deinococcus sonorensis]|uniref:Diguanylate cyclase domain-containing protein n=1 Tax=Deinococcus sonorensis TaxID=309891 RepID=A0ABV8Y6S0_9DEIO
MTPYSPPLPEADPQHQLPLDVPRLLAEADHLKYVRVDDAQRLAEQARRSAEALNDERSQALALTILGGCAFYRSEYDAALTHHAQAHHLSRGRYPDIELRVTNGLSVLHHQRGDYAQAMTFALDSLQLVQALGDPAGEARVLSNMGNMHWDIQEYDRALDLHREALARLRQLPPEQWTPGVSAQVVIVQLNTAVAAYHLGQYPQTLQESDAVLAQCQALQLHQPEAIMRTYRAFTLLELGQLEAAEQECTHALSLHRAGGDRDHQAMTLIARGRVRLQRGQPDDATVDLQGALQLAQDLQLRQRESEAHRWLAEALEHQGAHQDALRHFKRFYALQRELHDLTLDRKTKILTVQARVLSLQREAALERDRRASLEQVNAELRRAEEHVRHLAYHDALTGLPNRKLLMERLEQALSRARHVPARHGVMFIDLDGFKRVNDTLGHASGDVLLQQVALRLQRMLRETDTVARMAGDEFVVFAQDTSGAGALQLVGDRIVEALRSPFSIGGTDVQVSASVGYACFPDDALTVDSLLHCADTAMYRAKRHGKNRVCRHTDVEAASTAHGRGTVQ